MIANTIVIRIAAMKTKRTASPSKSTFGQTMPNSSFSAMGNPFGGTTGDSNNNNSGQQQPSTGFSFGASTPAFGSNTNSNPMFGSSNSSTPAFGNNNTSSTPAFGNFGASPQGPAASGGMFGGSVAASSSGFTFGGGGAGNNPFASSQPAAAQSNQGFSFAATPAPSNTTPGTFGTGKSNPFGSFGQTSNTNGASSANASDNDMMISPPASPEKKGTGLDAAPTASIFGTLSGNAAQPAANPFAAIKNDATPAAAPKFSFGQTSVKTADATTSQPASTPFSGFGAASTSKADTAAPVPAANPAPLFGSSTATPSFGFGGINNASSPAKPAEGSISNGNTASSTSSANNTTSSPFKGFGTTNTNASPFKGFATPQLPSSASSNSLFGQTNTSAPQNATESPAKPIRNLFGAKAAETVPTSATPATTNNTPAYPSLAATNDVPTTGFSNKDTTDLSDEQRQAYITQLKFRALNANLQAALMESDQNGDLSDIMKAYISQAVSFSTNTRTPKRPRESNDDVTANATSKRVRAESAAPSESGSPSKSKTAALFQNILDRKDEPSTPPKTTATLFAPSTTPQGSPAKNVFAGFGAQQKPAEASTASPAKNVFAGFGAQSKPAETNTQEASRPANPFAAVAKAPTSTPPMFAIPPASTSTTPAVTPAPPMFGNPTSTTPAVSKPVPPSSFQVKPASAAQPTTTTFEWKPINSALVASGPPAFQVPKFGGGAPSGTDFMASFAAKAKEDTDKMMAEAKAKRKAEDFDSDEDDEAEWERKDAEEQAAKKAKLDEDAKKQAKFVPGRGFTFGDALPKQAPITAFQVPKFGNGSTTAPNFLSAFSDKAKQDTEKMLAEAKAKRKAEDFDSEEDDEEEWERKDAEEQAAKKAQLEADSKKVARFVPGKGFVFTDSIEPSDAATNTSASPADTAAAALSVANKQSSSEADKQSSSTSVFANSAKATPAPSNPFAKFAAKPADDSADYEDSADDEAENTATKKSTTNGKSMFDRVTPADKPASSLFGSPAQDKTWKPDSPIKFGDAKPSVGFSFGIAATPKTDNVMAPPSTGAFGFLSKPNSAVTSTTTSRAASPGPTDSDTPADGNADADAESQLPQTDLTALTADEKRTESVLFETERARCMFFDKANKDSPWDVKGTGPLRVLKNKNTDVVRIVVRIAPSGKVAINTRLNSEVKYEFKGKGMVQFGIAKEGGVVEQWMIKVKEDDVAKQFAEICKDWQNH